MNETTQNESGQFDPYSQELAEPKEFERIAIPNGNYTCVIQGHVFRDVKDSFLEKNRERQAKKAEDWSKQHGESAEQTKNRIDRAIKAVPIKEFAWACLILDDITNSDGKNVRGQILEPTASYVKTKNERAIIVKYMKIFEGEVKSNWQCIKNWDGKFVDVSVEQSQGGYPKAKFTGLLKGDKLEFAQKLYEKYKEAKKMEEEALKAIGAT